MDQYSFLQQKSLPLTLKRHAPAAPCVAFLYSEEHMSVFHMFATVNLRHSIEVEARAEIANILAHDTHARIGWIPCADSKSRDQLLHSCAKQYGLPAILSEAA